MVKPLTSWLVPSFSQHNCRLVVSGRYLHVSVTKYEDKFASLGQVNSPNSWDKFQICCTDMCLIRFLLNFAVFCEFLWISRLRYCSKYQKPCTYELRHLHITNWRLKICIWRLHFSGWSPKGDLKIFLISSPGWPWWNGNSITNREHKNIVIARVLCTKWNETKIGDTFQVFAWKLKRIKIPTCIVS